jgi:hypothetical protein
MQLCMNKFGKKLAMRGSKICGEKKDKNRDLREVPKKTYRRINRGLVQTEFGKAIFFTAYSLVLVLSTLRGHLSQLQRLLVQ